MIVAILVLMMDIHLFWVLGRVQRECAFADVILVDQFVGGTGNHDRHSSNIILRHLRTVFFDRDNFPRALEWRERIGSSYFSGSVGFDAKIAELHFHGRSCVKLERKDPIHCAFGFALVGDVDGLFAVDELLEMIALGDDDIFVPVALFERGLDFIGAADRAGHLFLAIFIQNDFFAASREDAAHPLFIENTGVGRSGFHIGLIATDDPTFWIQNFAAILDSGIGETFGIEGLDFEGAAEFEIADGIVGPDQESVVFDGVLLAGLANDCAVLDRPKIGVAIPAGEVFAVEDGSEAFFGGGGSGLG